MANPIQSVNGVAVATPYIFKWSLQDISDSNAGRTEDTLMHKNRIGQKRKIELSWRGLNTAQVSAILQAFNNEYVEVVFLDALAGTYLSKTFYVGDRSTPMYSSVLDIWENVSFNIIEQ